MNFIEHYLIIDDVDTAFLTQNSWLVLLQKQLTRNLYLFKLHQSNPPNKSNLKNLFAKLKSAINKHITTKMKNKKLNHQISPSKNSLSPSYNHRTKTQQIRPSLNLLNSLSKTPKLSNYRYIQHGLSGDKLPCGQRKSLAHLSFLPCNKSSQEEYKKLNESKSKRVMRKSVDYKLKMGTSIEQSKPILSLHELQLNKKQLVSSQNIVFSKQMTHMETLLIRSSMNSPKRYLNSEGCNWDRKMSDQLPVISSPNKISMSEILNHMRSVEGQSRQEIVDFGKFLQSLKGSEMRKSFKKTQQTKQSQSENGYGLESIIEEGINDKKMVEDRFGESHIKCSSMSRNYRISRIRNIRFPLT